VQWAKANGYRPLSNSNFKQEMESLKYFYKKSGERFYEGLDIDDEKCKKIGLINNDPWQQKSF
jgi:hypothetical protein